VKLRFGRPATSIRHASAISDFMPLPPRAILGALTLGRDDGGDQALANSLDIGAGLPVEIRIRHRDELVGLV